MVTVSQAIAYSATTVHKLQKLCNDMIETDTRTIRRIALIVVRIHSFIQQSVSVQSLFQSELYT
jgi:hypothetical protein